MRVYFFLFRGALRRQAAASPSVTSLRLKIRGSRIHDLSKGGGCCKLSSCDVAGFAITVAQRCKLQPDSAGRSWEEDQSSYSSCVTAVRPGLDKAAEMEERNFSTVAEPSLQNTHKRAEERKRTYVEHFAVIFIRYYEKSPSLYVWELAFFFSYMGILCVYWQERLLALLCTSDEILGWQTAQYIGI